MSAARQLGLLKRGFMAAVAALGTALGAGSPASALEFSKHPSDSATENAIWMTGKIEQDDLFRFQSYISKLPQKKLTTIYLDSGGGLLLPAFEIGRFIHRAKMRTAVVGDAKVRCSSACAYILMAGRDPETGKAWRVKGSANNVGFHRFTPTLADNTKFGKKEAENVEARAQKTIYDIVAYMLEVDGDIELVAFSLKQSNVYNISNQQAVNHGIDVLDAKTGEIVSAAAVRRTTGN